MSAKRLWMCLSLLLLVGAGPTTQTAEEHSASGTLEGRYAVSKDGIRSGPFKTFYPDGKTKESGNYSNGKLNGTFTGYHPNGTPSLQCTYRDGALDGLCIKLDDTGHKMASTDYRAGKHHGFLREYKGEKLVAEQLYIDDALIYSRSPAIIAGALAEIRKARVETAPSTEQLPAHKGEVPTDRDEAMRLLMEYRYLCNVPYKMSLDAGYDAHDEAAAALLAQIWQASHDPTIPGWPHNPPNPGWPEPEYQFAHKGCASSNVQIGSASASSAVRSFMNDSDPSNIDRVGHRRWCLNPAMAKAGFGAAGQCAVVMWSFDSSRPDVPDYEYVAYPGPGFFPATHFDASAAWNVSVNPRKFASPDKGTVKVTVKVARVVQSPLGIKTAEELRLNYVNVETSGIGIPNAIIFRPDKCSTAPGSAYQVEIVGLRTQGNVPASIKYLVEFYNPGK